LRAKEVNDVAELKREGLSIQAISSLTGFDRKTVRKYLLEPDAIPAYGPRPPAVSKLDGFKPYLEERLKAVVEGYFDCLKIHQAGFPFVVALMGTVLFPATEALLRERFRRVLLLLDGDGSGRRATARIAVQLAGKCSVRCVAVPDGSQPDQLNRAELAALLAGNLGEEGATT
jgi:hypothetical protein